MPEMARWAPAPALVGALVTVGALRRGAGEP